MKRLVPKLHLGTTLHAALIPSPGPSICSYFYLFVNYNCINYIIVSYI